MKIRDLLKEKEITLSFEVFPPKTADKYEAVAQATEGIASLKPDFMSVTYGARGRHQRPYGIPGRGFETELWGGDNVPPDLQWLREKPRSVLSWRK